jgi:hypothetical protein
MIPGLEELIEAILRGQLGGERYDSLTKTEKMISGQAVVSILIPALPVLEEIKAAAWEEGSEARDKYLRDTFTSTSTAEAPKEPVNPYRRS